jgi:hypothetical protein
MRSGAIATISPPDSSKRPRGCAAAQAMKASAVSFAGLGCVVIGRPLKMRLHSRIPGRMRRRAGIGLTRAMVEAEPCTG